MILMIVDNFNEHQDLVGCNVHINVGISEIVEAANSSYNLLQSIGCLLNGNSAP